jgi:propanol-preferring alcohol dehydrogenase
VQYAFGDRLHDRIATSESGKDETFLYGLTERTASVPGPPLPVQVNPYQMQAMVLSRTAGIDESPLELKNVPMPEPEVDEVRVKVKVCAVCRTDLHIIEGDLPEAKRPVIPGHQVVGIVEKVGAQCQRLKVGQRVGIAWLRGTDGSCAFCRSGRENLCRKSRYTGYHIDGGYGEYAVVPENFAYDLPDSIDDVTVSPLLCAGLIGYRALIRADVPERGRLLLIGFGSSAHIVLQMARFRGCDVYVVTRSPEHVQLASSMGAAWAGNDLGSTPALAHSAILFAPVGNLVPPAMERLERGGILSIAGVHLSDVPPLNYERQLFYEKEIRTVTSNTREDGRNLLAEATAAGVRPHVTTYPLADANHALQDLKHSRIDGSGVLLVDAE